MTGFKQTGMLTQFNAMEYNLGTLLQWHDEMIREGVFVKFPFQKYNHKHGHFVTPELIKEHFRSMPQYELCSLNHQCTKADFEAMRQ